MYHRLLSAVLIALLCGCSQNTNNAKTPGAQPVLAVADSYTFTQGVLSRVEKANGLLANDTAPAGSKLTLKTLPQRGTLELSPDGSFSYQHDGSTDTADRFSYTLSGPGGESGAEVTLTLQPSPPDAPVAVADAYTLEEGATLNVGAEKGVLSNDTNPLKTALSTELVEAPAHGQLSLKSDGSFTYTHDHSQTTQDGFTYRSSNGTKTAQARVLLTINPLDDQPKIDKLELVQTHLIPAEGRSWAGDKLAKYNLHLVGSREALVLLDLSSAANRVDSPVLEALLRGQKLGEVTLNTPATLPKTEAGGPTYSTTAYWAMLDKAWVRPGLELRVRANEGQVSASRAVRVGAPSSFTLYTLPFYLFGLTEADIPLSQTGAPDLPTQDEYFAKHPFARLEALNHPAQKIVWPYIVVGPRQGRAAQRVTYKEQQGDGYAVMSAVLDTLSAIRDANGDGPTANHYYAPLLMANQAGSYSGPGGGLGGGHRGTGDHAYRGVFIHEQGHAFGMPHANDGYTDGTYPYVGGSLKGSSWGYDQTRQEFLGTFVPTTASRFAGCRSGGFPMGRQLDEQGRCVKQDPMQSGSGDQAAGYRFTMFSDFNAAVVQHYLEGTAKDNAGKRTYDGGRIFVDPTSSTGYSRWDSLDARLVSVEPKTSDGGVWGFEDGLPLERNVPVHTVVLTASLTSTQAPLTYNLETTQIYPPLSYTGNLRRLIDPTDASGRALIVPNTGTYYWYCRASGCDYTLRVTYADGSTQHLALQGGFRGWFSSSYKAGAADPLSGDSFKVWGVNLPAQRALHKIELLETPEVWKGMPASPKVVASRTVGGP
ncbi:MAG: M66 family metalloprotease [Meiothermus sp.]|nr:M66 family metalloprotease [Meiothermus sp.]